MLGRGPDGPSRSHPAAPAERGYAQAFGHGYPVRLRTLGQPGLGAVPAARLPGESGDDQGRHASTTGCKNDASTSPITKAAAPRAEQAHLCVTAPAICPASDRA